MKTLLVMRHAKSSHANNELSDYQRPLNERGDADAPHMGQLLQAQSLTPELIITSSAVRALSTAEHVAEHSGYTADLQVLDRLYLAPYSEYIQVLYEMAGDYDRVLVLGHNPGIEELIARLVFSWQTITTANLAHIQLPINVWTDLEVGAVRGELVKLWRPKELTDHDLSFE